MGQEKIPVTSEKKYAYAGIFDIMETYSFLKSYLEDSMHYDVTEKDYEEKNDGKSKSILVKFEAEKEYNDYYKIIIKYSLDMKGKDIAIEHNGRVLNRIDGNAKITVNCYIEPDWLEKRQHSALGKFLDQIYNKYISKSELDKCIMTGVMDVGELLSRFKQQMNTTL